MHIMKFHGNQLFYARIHLILEMKGLILLLILPTILCAQPRKNYNSIEEAIKNPDQVHKLFLNGQNLTQVPPEIAKFKNLDVLDLSDNHITELPNFLFDLKGLSYLDISDNKLTKISEKIRQFTSLLELYANNNELTTLPASIAKLPALGIYLSHNKIESIPPEMSNMMLEVLDLSHNEIEALPKSIGHFRADILKLNHNKIKELPQSFDQITINFELNLAANPIRNFPDKMFNCNDLDELNLKRTKLGRKKIQSIRLVMDYCDVIG